VALRNFGFSGISKIFSNDKGGVNLSSNTTMDYHRYTFHSFKAALSIKGKH